MMKTATPSPVKAIRAPAKLNLRLKVTGKRPDGYHELVSVMVPVALFDRLELRRTGRGRIDLSCRGRPVPVSEDNLIFRAARRFYSRTGIEPGISIRMTKRIPVSAGLGGGSSDAAATLRALNEIHGSPLDPGKLAEVAVGLGADVPFFLKRGPCLATGIGEVLSPIRNWPEFWYVIVSPPCTVSTAWVYANLNLTLTTGEYGYINRLLRKASFTIGELLENDLETVTIPRFPLIAAIKKALLAEGASGALMSGSGASVFGIFLSREQADVAKDRLALRGMGDVFSVGQVTGS